MWRQQEGGRELWDLSEVEYLKDWSSIDLEELNLLRKHNNHLVWCIKQNHTMYLPNLIALLHCSMSDVCNMVVGTLYPVFSPASRAAHSMMLPPPHVTVMCSCWCVVFSLVCQKAQFWPHHAIRPSWLKTSTYLLTNPRQDSEWPFFFSLSHTDFTGEDLGSSSCMHSLHYLSCRNLHS